MTTPPAEPRFKKAVEIVLQTFAVLVGVALTDFWDDAKCHISEAYKPYAFILLIGLLLRFIVGSAIHLDRTYVRDATSHRDGIYFLKDLAFLVLFGWLAIFLVHSPNIAHFLRRAAWFTFASLVWSGIEPHLRPQATGPSGIARYVSEWVRLDLFQTILTVGIGWCVIVHGRLDNATLWLIVLDIVYVGAFARDFFLLTDGAKTPWR